jgi:hypothetical protein
VTDISPWRVCSRGNSDGCKGALEMGHVSLWELCLGEPGGRGLFPVGPGGYERRLWGWASLTMGAQLGNLEWAHLPGTFEIWLKGALEGECLSLSLCVGAL